MEGNAALIEALRDIARQLTGIARNIDQIARSAIGTGDPDYRASMEERARLGKELARTLGPIQETLELAARTGWRGWTRRPGARPWGSTTACRHECRVSRVACRFAPATPDTDTRGLHDNLREGLRQPPGGYATTSGRVCDNLREG